MDYGYLIDFNSLIIKKFKEYFLFGYVDFYNEAYDPLDQ